MKLKENFPIVFHVFKVPAASKPGVFSLKSRPHLAINIKGLVLLLPQPSAFRADDIVHLTRALHLCVNLKELEVLFEEYHPNRRRPGSQEPKYSSLTYMLNDHRFKLTKFVNGYFSQDNNAEFETFLRSQPKLESLELHSGKVNVSSTVLPYNLKTLGCPPQIFDHCYGARWATRVRLDFENLKDKREINVLGLVLYKSLTRDMKSLAIFLRQSQTHFSEIICVIAANHIYVQHLEIHQFLPTQIEKSLLLPVNPCYGWNIRTLVFRPPPGRAKKAGDNLCAYVELRTPIGRRKVAEKLIMQTLPSLTRLVLVVHGNDYEFRRNTSTSVITGEHLITRNIREWSLVK